MVQAFVFIGLAHLGNNVFDCWQLKRSHFSLHVPRLQRLKVLSVDIGSSLLIQFVFAIKLVEIVVR